MDEDAAQYVEMMRAVLADPTHSFVLFERGTVVVLESPAAGADLAATAQALMREFGPVHAGSAAGDFGLIELPDAIGWAVTSHHPNMFTLMTPDEAPDATHATGLIGREKRNADARSLNVVHVEDRRG